MWASIHLRLVLFISICLIFINISGCAISGGRLYSGPPLPPEKISFIHPGQYVFIESIFLSGQGRAIFRDPLYGRSDEGLDGVFELLPGNYTVRIYFSSVSYGRSGVYQYKYTTGTRLIPINLNAQPGHIYYITMVSSGDGFFEPNIADISRDEDYARLVDGNEIKRRLRLYLEGERPIIESK